MNAKESDVLSNYQIKQSMAEHLHQQFINTRQTGYNITYNIT